MVTLVLRSFSYWTLWFSTSILVYTWVNHVESHFFTLKSAFPLLTSPVLLIWSALLLASSCDISSFAGNFQFLQFQFPSFWSSHVSLLITNPTVDETVAFGLCLIPHDSSCSKPQLLLVKIPLLGCEKIRGFSNADLVDPIGFPWVHHPNLIWLSWSPSLSPSLSRPSIGYEICWTPYWTPYFQTKAKHQIVGYIQWYSHDIPTKWIEMVAL